MIISLSMVSLSIVGAGKLIGMLFHLFREAADWGGNRLDKAEKGKKKKGEGEQRTLVAMEGRWIQSPLQSHPIASCNELFLRQEG